MKNNKEEIKAVEFMRDARTRLTEKYVSDKGAFKKELNDALSDFLKLRKMKGKKVA